MTRGGHVSIADALKGVDGRLLRGLGCLSSLCLCAILGIYFCTLAKLYATTVVITLLNSYGFNKLKSG
jgi:hypothetical protein